MAQNLKTFLIILSLKQARKTCRKRYFTVNDERLFQVFGETEKNGKRKKSGNDQRQMGLDHAAAILALDNRFSTRSLELKRVGTSLWGKKSF